MTSTSLPPIDVEAEVAVLGSLILIDSAEAARVVTEIVTTGDFHSDPHRIVFRNVLDLWETTQACDILLLRAALMQGNELDAVGGTAFLQRLVASVPSTANAPHYAKIVRRASLQRRIIELQALHEQAMREDGNGAATRAFEQLTAARSELDTFENPRPKEIEVVTWDYADTANDPAPPEPDQLVQRLLTRVSTNIVFGPSGSGKSWAVQAMSLDAAMGGGNFMGAEDLYITPKRELRDGRDDSVLWLFGSEDTQSRVNSRVRKIHMSGPHSDRLPPAGAWIYGKRPRGVSLKTARGARWLEAQIDRYKPTILVLDTVRSLCPDLNVNDAEDVMPFMDMLNGLRDQYQLTTFAIHHTRKGSSDPKKSEESKADAMLGSETWRSQADACLMIDAKDGNTLDVMCRVVKQKDLPSPIYSWRASFMADQGRFRVLDEDEEAPTQETIRKSGRPAKFSAEAVLALRERFPSGLRWDEETLVAELQMVHSTWSTMRERVATDLLARDCVFIDGFLRWPS